MFVYPVITRCNENRMSAVRVAKSFLSRIMSFCPGSEQKKYCRQLDVFQFILQFSFLFQVFTVLTKL